MELIIFGNHLLDQHEAVHLVDWLMKPEKMKDQQQSATGIVTVSVAGEIGNTMGQGDG